MPQKKSRSTKKASASSKKEPKDKDTIIEELKARISALEAERESLKEHFNNPQEAEAKVLDLFKREKLVNNKSQALARKEKLLSQELEELNSRYEKLKKEKEQLHTNSEKLKVRESDVQRREDSLKQLQAEVQENKKILDSQISSIEEEKKQLAHYTEYFKQQKNLLESLQPDIEGIHAEIQKKEEQIIDIKKELSHLQRQSQENAEVESRLDQRLNTKLLKNEDKLNEVISRFERSNEAIQKQINNLMLHMDSIYRKTGITETPTGAEPLSELEDDAIPTPEEEGKSAQKGPHQSESEQEDVAEGASQESRDDMKGSARFDTADSVSKELESELEEIDNKIENIDKEIQESASSPEET